MEAAASPFFLYESWMVILFFFFNGVFDRGALFVFLFGAVKIMTDFAIALPVVLVAIT